MTASSITIVTKNTSQSYTGGTSAAAKGTVLSVLEVDSNFINLKEGIINVETDLTTYVNSTFITALNANLIGTPTAPTPGAGAGNFQIQTVGGVSALVTPISTLVNSAQTGNLALQSLINFKAPLASPAFTGFPQLSGATYNFTGWDAATSYLATVEYVQDKLINLTGTVKPTTAGGVSIGTSTEHVNELHVNTVLPAGANATIGTPTNRFTFGYFDTGDFGPNTILVGSAEISANGTTLVVPVNTAIGNQENVIPPNLASTTVDKRFSELSIVDNLDQTFTASGAITARDPVAINANGTVSTISASVSNLEFIGIALASAADSASVTVRVHGKVTGFSGLTDNTLIFAETNGTLTQTKTTSALKVGVATSSTEAFFFTTSNLDTYLLNIKKAELNDFSITANASASGSGGLSYNNATGEFTLTPADTSTFATTSYVNTQVASLVDSAPGSLDTLNELAAALNDDASFSTTVTDSIALKAPLASPALTGTPTAPTAATSTNTTQLATTAFVQAEISGLGNANLNSFSVTSNSASGGGSLAYNNANGVFTYTPPALFDGAFGSLTSKPTTIAGYGISDAVPFASPTFTGTPAAPTASSGTNTTQIATTEFVQAAVTGGSGIALTDLSTSTLAASSGGALSYNNANGVFTYTPPDLSSFTTFDGAFSSLTGKPTTISGYGITDAFDGVFNSLTSKPTTVAGYGITDALSAASPALTGTPTAPTAASSTNTTQLATTEFVQTAVSGFSSTGGDSQRDYTADTSITAGDPVILNSSGNVETVSVQAAGYASSSTITDSASNDLPYRKHTVDYNDNDGVYLEFYQPWGTNWIGRVLTPNLSALSYTVGSAQTVINADITTTAGHYHLYTHIPGTSKGVLSYYTGSVYKARIITYSSGTLSAQAAITVSETITDAVVTPAGVPLLLVEETDGTASVLPLSVSGNTLTAGTKSNITGLTNGATEIFWHSGHNKIVVADLNGTNLDYSVGTISGTTVSMGTKATVATTNTYTEAHYHKGTGNFILSRVGPNDALFRVAPFNGTTITVAAAELNPSWSIGTSSNSWYSSGFHFSTSSDGFILSAAVKQGNYKRLYIGVGAISANGTFTSTSWTSITQYSQAQGGGQATPSPKNNPDGYSFAGFHTHYNYQQFPDLVGRVLRLDAVSNYTDYLGIAQNTVAQSATTTVMLAGAVSDQHSGLTQDTKYYVQTDGTLATTISSVLGGVAVASDSIQVADSLGVFDKTIAFDALTGKPTTLAGYGIGDPVLTSGADIDIGSNDFITTGKSYYANMFATTGDLPSATTYHGMFAHVHGTGGGYFAHAGNWVELANKSYVDTEVANLVNSAPATLDTLDELAAALNDDANFATTITTSLGLKAPLASPALTGVPTAPTAATSTNTTQIATTAFVTAAVAAGGGGGGSSVTTDDTAPSAPSDGDLWYDTANGGMFVYYQDADSSQWVEVIGSQGSAGAAGTDGGLDAWTEKTSAYTAVAGNRLIVDTSTAVTVTLPTSASIGDEVRIIDGTGNAGTNNITIARNGHKIQGDASDLTISTDRAAFGLVYYNVANGWVLTER